jgi:6-pyruvoyltetrahydropterin/6-carboxytetrahydropterin synthase
VCERLHGHNYRVAVELRGPLDENYYVVDFLAVRDSLQQIILDLDHRMLLPTQHRWIKVDAGPSEVEVTCGDRRWVFPRGDCALLAVENTTAELLARYIGRRLLAALSAEAGFQPEHLRVAVDENQGQWGVWESEPGRGGDGD